jgi:hypothetical protein
VKPARVFRPADAPLCEKCELPLAFTQLENGKWRPCNPDGSDHWDICRDVRYAKAKSGEMIEKVTDYPDCVERIVYWNGGRKPFLVMHSIMGKNQIKPAPGGGLIPLEQHLAHAKQHGYTVIER